MASSAGVACPDIGFDGRRNDGGRTRPARSLQSNCPSPWQQSHGTPTSRRCSRKCGSRTKDIRRENSSGRHRHRFCGRCNFAGIRRARCKEQRESLACAAALRTRRTRLHADQWPFRLLWESLVRYRLEPSAGYRISSAPKVTLSLSREAPDGPPPISRSLSAARALSAGRVARHARRSKAPLRPAPCRWS